MAFRQRFVPLEFKVLNSDIVLREGQQRVAVGLRDEYANVRSAASLNIWLGNRQP